ncbi:MAG: sigma-70 family RNA polymerase sigma factor [Bacteroidales bacterium]|nr:sigma-70 family RNA polymerase sigma factor [Bacteroidales bacterium]MDI9593548.1 sigma-70 family RNA polymerase sigma factor [Bacteroidota bacterium]NLH33349.1 sigma-70 family RNA polymerase sigma factor [Lentimicrobium sp.]OQC37902.1 MAG: ECF RNA polymerase sigma factor SigE [Bacteroidetes bacterium ADurb.Bin041]MBP7873466.1 sigma-70 family RNA polymerase sigma factor [Bacteroidales bacterium]
MDQQKVIEGCIKGIAKAQQELFNHFANEMFGVCIYYSSNRVDAEDTLHEGFLKVFQNIKSFKGKGSLKGWIRRIMINTALEKYRKKSPLYLLDDQYIESANDINRDDIVSNITADDLIGLIQELTPQYRAVFNLYALEGLTHKEIAEKLNISEGTSKSNLSRARTILQQKVKAHFYVSSKNINA